MRMKKSLSHSECKNSYVAAKPNQNLGKFSSIHYQNLSPVNNRPQTNVRYIRCPKR